MTFDGAELEAAVEKAYQKNKFKFSVNGFRKGKAPRNVVEHAYGKGVFYEDALNILFNENYSDVLDKEKSLFVVGNPELNLEDFSEDKVVLTAVVPVKPEVKIESYKGMKIRKYEYNVKDEDVEAEVKKALSRKAEKKEVTDQPAKSGDVATIDFVGSVDGKEFEGGAGEDYDLELGSGTFIPGFEDQVVGMKVGEKKDVKVKFPDNYQAENLKGKDAVFAVTLKKLQEKVLPELTDEYVKENFGSATVQEYKDKTKDRLQKQLSSKATDETENSILEAISAKSSAEIPDAMIETEIDNLVKRFEYQLMYQGLKLDDYLKYMNVKMEDFRKNYEEQAKKNVLSQLIISSIIEQEKIEASEDEINGKVKEQAESVGKTYEEYKKSMDPRQFEYIKNDIVITKLFDFLKENNKLYLEETK